MMFDSPQRIIAIIVLNMKLLKFILSFLLLLVLTPTVSHSKNLVKKWPLISTKQYSALSKVQQKKYIQELRLAVLNFEKTLKSKGEKYSFYESILETLFPQAYANTIDSNQCIIGGLIRKKVNGLCPTYGRGKGCKTSDGSMMTDGFRCGIIYGSACVPRKEINSLSERCHQAGQSSYPTANEYAKYKEMLWRLQSELCTNEQKATPCEFMRIRLEELEKNIHLKFKAMKINLVVTELMIKGTTEHVMHFAHYVQQIILNIKTIIQEIAFDLLLIGMYLSLPW